MREGFTVIDEVSIASEFDSLYEVENFIEKVCNNFGAEENYGNVLIAVTEAVNNAIIHGNRKDKDLLVQVCVADASQQYCFVVLDAGQGFDFNNLPDPTAPENIEKENGRGIFLMKNLSDEVEFSDYGRSVTVYFTK
jgi:serine/threonine-protein kinase RsbW